MHIFGKYTKLVGIVRPSMQGSRAPSFIAGNELIGCMCPRTCSEKQDMAPTDHDFWFVTEHGTAEI